MVKRAKQLQEKGPKAKQQKKEETFNDKLNSRDAYQSPKKDTCLQAKGGETRRKKKLMIPVSHSWLRFIASSRLMTQAER